MSLNCCRCCRVQLVVYFLEFEVEIEFEFEVRAVLLLLLLLPPELSQKGEDLVM